MLRPLGFSVLSYRTPPGLFVPFRGGALRVWHPLPTSDGLPIRTGRRNLWLRRHTRPAEVFSPRRSRPLSRRLLEDPLAPTSGRRISLEICSFARFLRAPGSFGAQALLTLLLNPDAPHNRGPAMRSALPRKKLYPARKMRLLSTRDCEPKKPPTKRPR